MDSVLTATVRRVNNHEKNKQRISQDIEYVLDNLANPETKAALIKSGIIQTIFNLNSTDVYDDDIRTCSLKFSLSKFRFCFFSL